MTAQRRQILQLLLGLALAAPSVRVVGRSIGGDAVRFDHPGGFQRSTFTLTLTTPAGRGTIYYTTNGDPPLPTPRNRYVRPLGISATTIVRAAHYSEGTSQIGEVARTFLFDSNILAQTGGQFPSTWGANRGASVPAWYGMTTVGEEHSDARRRVAASLRSLPTLCLIAAPADLFSAETGIYTHPQERGGAWERPSSLEMFDADGKPVFQCGAGLRIHGGNSRRPEVSPKHSFRLTFKNRYGSDRLEYSLFGANGAQSCDRLVLRAGNNDSWVSSRESERRHADYLRDEWMRRSMAALGHPSARGRFVHLYLNGLYWGVYDLCEQPGPALLAADPASIDVAFDVRKANKIEAGDEVAWNQMMRLVNAGVSEESGYNEAGRFLDLPELADYLILNYYAGNSDWDRTANWYALRPRTPGGKFQFLVWDGECTLRDADADTLEFDDDESPPRLFHALSENAGFRKLFSARARQLLSGDGPLAPEPAAARYRALADSVALALPAEAARWGNYRRDSPAALTGPGDGYTVEEFWRAETNRILTEYFPRRREVVENQFRARGLLLEP